MTALLGMAFAVVVSAETVCEFARPERPDGLSAISRIEGDRYYCVDDSGGMLHEVEIKLNDSEEDGTFKVLRSVRLEGRRDLEGCAFDPLDKRVWVSDEHDHSIRQFDPASGKETDRVEIPAVYLENMVCNRSFEGLAMSPDGLRLYAANEDTLKCDGPVANNERGGLIRVQEFERARAGQPWRATRQWFYPTEKVGGEKYSGQAVSGVSALCASGDGTLLVLEREMSMKNPMFPTFQARIFAISLSDISKPVKKHSVWDEATMFSNYEGFCLGPKLKDGSGSMILVSDGDGNAEENLQILTVKKNMDGKYDIMP